MMHLDPLIAAAVVITAPFYGAAVWLLAKGARGWSKAIDAAHRARYAGIQADVAQAADAALTETRERKPRADYTPPTDEEVAEAIKLERTEQQRSYERVTREYTTEGNELGEEPVPPIPGPHGEYADGG